MTRHSMTDRSTVHPSTSRRSPIGLWAPLIVPVAVLGWAAVAHGSTTTPAPPPCTDPNPWLSTTSFVRGIHPPEAAVVGFRHGTGSGPTVLATQREVGSAYGLAYDRPKAQLYVAAYHKRGSPFGPGGPGAVYRLDFASGVIAPWVIVPNAGPDVHDGADGFYPDWQARADVGKTGLGDIDLSEDGAELFVMNLYDRKIYRFRTTDGLALGTIPMGAAAEAWAADARPFGLALHLGKLYHGVVDSAVRSGAAGDLTASVYESALDGGGMRLVNRFGLDFERGQVDHPAGVPARWRPWNERLEWAPGTAPGTGWNINPQPLLSDIEFAVNNDMLLGFRDRYGDMGYYDPSGLNPDGEATTISAGDILIARFKGSLWETQPTPEFFVEDYGPSFGAFPAHDETGFGGLARVQAVDEVVTSAFAPLDIVTGGALWFSNVTGANPYRKEIYRLNGTVNFAKANGLGDVEQLCEGPTRAPTATPTRVVASPTPTPTVSAPTRTPMPTPTDEPSRICVCALVHQKAPPVVVQDAMANPGRYYGWRYLLDPNKPESPVNPRRECLTLRHERLGFHPIFNGPVWRVGCP